MSSGVVRYCLIVDNPFNRHWYAKFISKYFLPTECPPYANFEFVDLTVHDHPDWSHEATSQHDLIGPCTIPWSPA